MPDGSAVVTTCPACNGTGKDAVQAAMSSTPRRLEPTQTCPICNGSGEMMSGTPLAFTDEGSMTFSAEDVQRIRQLWKRLNGQAGHFGYVLQEIAKACLLAERGTERTTLEAVLRIALEAVPGYNPLHDLDGQTRPRGGIDLPDEANCEPTTVA